MREGDKGNKRTRRQGGQGDHCHSEAVQRELRRRRSESFYEAEIYYAVPGINPLACLRSSLACPPASPACPGRQARVARHRGQACRAEPRQAALAIGGMPLPSYPSRCLTSLGSRASRL
jgi:hypothetical protein